MIGKEIIIFDSLDSSNNYVAKAISTGDYLPGTVIMSHFQTGGKGQRGARWESEARKNLTFSFAVDSKFLPMDQKFLLAKFISLAISDFIGKETGKKAEIKWPNDLLLSSKKVCGILIENRIGVKANWSICGIGLNLNQRNFPSDFKATSMMLEDDRERKPMPSLYNLLIDINYWFTILNTDKDKLRTEYFERLIGGGRLLGLETGSKRFNGSIEEVTDHGVLVIRDSNERIHHFKSKEVRILY